MKWVPLQSETGLSAGLKYEHGRERVSGEDTSHADALGGLATWAFEQGPRVHVNLGREWVRDDEDVNVWGVGLDVPLNAQLDFIVETFGAEHSGPDRQVGLRYAIAEGLKISDAPREQVRIVPLGEAGVVQARTVIPPEVWHSPAFAYLGLELYLPDSAAGRARGVGLARRLIRIAAACAPEQAG